MILIIIIGGPYLVVRAFLVLLSFSDLDLFVVRLGSSSDLAHRC